VKLIILLTIILKMINLNTQFKLIKLLKVSKKIIKIIINIIIFNYKVQNTNKLILTMILLISISNMIYNRIRNYFLIILITLFKKML
jgi:hypothetical protein